MVEKLPVGALLLRGGTVVYANPALCQALGYARNELAGRCVRDLVCGEDLPGAAASVRLRRKQGGEVIMACPPTPEVRLEDGPALLAVLHDPTPPRTLEAQLVLADRLAAVGTIVAGVGHEINNPLTSIAANIELSLQMLDELAARRGPDPLFDDVTAALEDTRAACERVRHIVRDLKVFSHPDDETRTRVDVHRVLEFSLRLAANEIRHRATLVREYGRLPPVAASEARLGQVFLNLLLNAAQALPEGQADRHQIRVRTGTEAGGRVVVEVIDTGPGMPPEVLERLFTPFFTTKAPGTGSGLGLSITRGIVSDLGGEIRVESEPGRGSRFTVLLPPAAGDPEVPSPPDRRGDRDAGRRGRVLVVDDEPLIGRAVGRILGDRHEVIAVASARAALERLEAGERFDVILCDVMMPEMTARELHEHLAARRPDLASEVVFLTGGAFTARARQFLAEVPNARLEKPFDAEALRRLVRERVG